MKKNVLSIVLVLFLLGCQEREPPQKEAKQEPATCTVANQNVQAFVVTTGTVQLDLEGGAKISSPLAGTVEKIFVKIGEGVKQGTPLASVRSSDVSDAQAGYLSTQAQLKQAERGYDLNRKLFEIGAVTKNDLLASEANYEQSKALAEGLKKKLAIYGSTTEGGLGGTLTLRAPIAGRVVDIQAHLGDRFDSSAPLMTVANAAKSLIVANVYDTDLGKIHQGQKVVFTTDVFSEKTFQGVITYVSEVMDPDSKTVKTYIQPLSEKTLFKPNMFLRIRVLLGERNLAVLARSSVFYQSGRFYVYEKKGSSFALKQVKPIQDISDKDTAVEGLTAGEVIACSALDLEKP